MLRPNLIEPFCLMVTTIRLSHMVGLQAGSIMSRLGKGLIYSATFCLVNVVFSILVVGLVQCGHLYEALSCSF